MKGFSIYITPEEYDGYQELCDAANVAGAEGLISEESAELMAKFTKKMSDAHYKQIIIVSRTTDKQLQEL